MFSFCCYVWGPGCISSQENAVEPWGFLFSPGTTESQKFLLTSAIPYLSLLATFTSFINLIKWEKYCSTIASWGFLKIQRSWFSIASWVASSHVCLGKPPEKTLEHFQLDCSNMLLLFKAEDSGNEGCKPVQRCMMVISTYPLAVWDCFYLYLCTKPHFLQKN